MALNMPVALLLWMLLFKGISSAAYSKVFVQSGDRLPVEYVNYGGQTLPIGSQIAQISAAPVDSVISVPSVSAMVSPCVAPCVIPGGPFSALAPIASTANAKIVSYQSPVANVPIVLANKDEATGYQYAYAVYDESTGDKKVQSEQSDGSTVQGQYSFIQPDGYRREVIYTADDLKGFNAVVRNILADPDPSAVNRNDVKKDSLPPCNDGKSAQLTEQPSDGKAIETTDLAVDVEQIDVKTEAPTTTTVMETTTGEVTTIPTPILDTTAVVDSNSIDNAMITYGDIIRCLQAKLQSADLSSSPRAAISPLTYILLPSFGKPC